MDPWFLFSVDPKITVKDHTASLYNAHALPLFAQLNQLTIYDLNTLALATFMFCSHTNSLPPTFSDYFTQFTVNSAVVIIHAARSNFIFPLLAPT